VSASPRDLSASPTLTSPATQIGVILGTAAYMALSRQRVERSTSGPTSGRSAASSMRCSPAADRSPVIQPPSFWPR
jgi:hypothetical protein